MQYSAVHVMHVQVSREQLNSYCDAILGPINLKLYSLMVFSYICQCTKPFYAHPLTARAIHVQSLVRAHVHSVRHECGSNFASPAT